MLAPGQTAEHLPGLGRVTGLAKKLIVEHYDGVGGQRQLIGPGAGASLGGGQAGHIGAGILTLERSLVEVYRLD